MSLSHRLLLYVLAALPAVWGNCPDWFSGDACGGSAKTARAEHRCPCCRSRSEGERNGRPLPSRRGCDDCPMTVARRGSTPVPPSVELPDADLATGSLLPTVAAIPPAGTAPVDAAARPPGAPPDPRLLATVVLTI